MPRLSTDWSSELTSGQLRHVKLWFRKRDELLERERCYTAPERAALQRKASDGNALKPTGGALLMESMPFGRVADPLQRVQCPIDSATSRVTQGRFIFR